MIDRAPHRIPLTGFGLPPQQKATGSDMILEQISRAAIYKTRR
jgi:hypothetical protein